MMEIALLRSAHYVLVLATSDGYVTLFDPMVGVIKLPVSAYQQSWTGKSVQVFGRAP
jgi:hypothetical protein